MSAAVSASAGTMRTCYATAGAHIKRTLAYTIEIVRWPLFPLLFYITLLFTYDAAGRTSVDDVSPAAFLLVGIFGMVLWSTAIWSGGYAVESERYEGTINSLFLTPAGRGAVVIGYSLGSLLVFVWPTMLVAIAIAVVAGVDFVVNDPLAVLLSLAALIVAALALSYLLAGGFVLTRKANMFANLLQSPIYLLSGMMVPIDDLPEAVQWFAFFFPVSAGMEALRATLLTGASMGDVAEPLARLAIASIVLTLIGHWLLWKVEHAARNAGTLDFE